ncbi:MAG: hypothetical protein QXZ09_04630 [Candidatus Methanomethylicaceae archaeon]
MEEGSVVVVVRGYVGYVLFAEWTVEGIYFVPRQKGNLDFRVICRYPLPDRRNILRGLIIELKGICAKQDCFYPLRWLEFWDEASKAVLVLFTDHLEFGPPTTAVIYRWQIGIFFKIVKQSFKIKT